MSAFVYYVPGVQAASPDVLRNTGLGALLGPNITTRIVNGGPNGGTGLVICREGGSALYHAESQTWTAADTHWVGYENNARPGPFDLLRDDNVGGHAVKMGDGNQWLVPILRVAPAGPLLPHAHYFCMGEGGKFQSRLRPEFMALGQKVESMWTEYATRVGMIDTEAGDMATFTLEIDDDCSLIADALAFNYRVGKIEISLLALLTPSSLQKALEALLDIPTLLDIVKKNAVLESPDSGSGTAATPE